VRKGFTLVELTIVVGIISILMFVGSFAFVQTQKNIKQSQTIDNEQRVASLIFDYIRRTGQMPSSDLHEIPNLPEDPMTYPMPSRWYFSNYTIYPVDRNGNTITSLAFDLKANYPFFVEDTTNSYYGNYKNTNEPYSAYLGAPSIYLIQPNGGTLTAGSTYTIQWASSNLATSNTSNSDSTATYAIRILFYNGSSWSFVATNLPLTQTSYSWTVPSTSATGCKIRVGEYNTTTGVWVIYDDSDFTFTIQ
jgi:prepilin-type N-terminal cleavage/methylation domain-containing protein